MSLSDLEANRVNNALARGHPSRAIHRTRRYHPDSVTDGVRPAIRPELATPKAADRERRRWLAWLRLRLVLGMGTCAPPPQTQTQIVISNLDWVPVAQLSM